MSSQNRETALGFRLIESCLFPGNSLFAGIGVDVGFGGFGGIGLEG
jgi:hypothetical protein